VPTAGGALVARIEAAARERPRGLAFAARTDSGVHALANYATCFFRDPDFDFERFRDEVEAPRADGLLAVRAFSVSKNVHARGGSEGKRYRFTVDDRAADAGALRPHPFAWRIAPEIDAERMREAARLLEGEHDFSSLRAAGCSAGTPIKTLHRIRVRGPYPLVDGSRRHLVEVVGTAFLRKMMRNLVGILVEVGTGWRPVEDIPLVLEARDRKRAGLCAPPGGLTLVEVGFTWPDDGRFRIPLCANAATRDG